MPETPAWKYVEENKLITNVEEYLDQVAEFGGGPLVNLTKIPDRIWKNWTFIIRREMKLYYYKEKRLIFNYFYALLSYFVILEIFPLIPRKLKNVFKKAKINILNN